MANGRHQHGGDVPGTGGPPDGWPTGGAHPAPPPASTPPPDPDWPYDPSPARGDPPRARRVDVVLAAVGAVLLVAIVVPLLLVLGRDRGSGDPASSPPAIRDRELVAAAHRGCDAMFAELGRVPRLYLQEPGYVRAATIRAENEAIGLLLAELTAVGEDRLARDPTARRYVTSWRRLAEARAAYADDLDARRQATFAASAEAGATVVEWIASVRNACIVPPRLYQLD